MISGNVSKNLLLVLLFIVEIVLLCYSISFLSKKNHKVDDGTIPASVAIIMDGNGRWAQRRKLPISYGHKKGADNLVNILEYAKNIGIKSITLYAFSTENWKRPKEEVYYIFSCIDYFSSTTITKSYI